MSTYLPPLRRIAREVAPRYGLAADHLCSPRRLSPLMAARFEFCYRALVETDYSISRIGRFLGKDHTSVVGAAIWYALAHDLPMPRNLASWRRARYPHVRVYPTQGPRYRQSRQRVDMLIANGEL